MIHPEDRERVDRAVESVLDPAGTGTYDIEYRIVQLAGQVRSTAAKGRAKTHWIPISNLLYLLRGESSLDKREEYIAAAESELGRISDIASHTLRFYRDPVGLAEVDLAEMIESTLALFQPRIVTAGVQIERNLPKGLCVEGTTGKFDR